MLARRLRKHTLALVVLVVLLDCNHKERRQLIRHLAAPLSPHLETYTKRNGTKGPGLIISTFGRMATFRNVMSSLLYKRCESLYLGL